MQAGISIHCHCVTTYRQVERLDTSYTQRGPHVMMDDGRQVQQMVGRSYMQSRHFIEYRSARRVLVAVPAEIMEHL